MPISLEDHTRFHFFSPKVEFETKEFMAFTSWNRIRGMYVEGLEGGLKIE